MRFNLDVPVEKRKVAARGPISFALEFPAAAGEALGDWRVRAACALGAMKPGRVPGPVRLTLIYEERAGRRDLGNLIGPVVGLLVSHALIDSDHRACLREVRAGWAHDSVRGVRVTIEPAGPHDGGAP